MATKLRDVQVNEISLVDRPANKGARVLIMKAEGNDVTGIGITGFAKMEIAGHSSGLSRQRFETAIIKRAAEIRKAGESDAQAFTRTITQDDDGRLLYQASKIAPQGDAVQDFVGDEKPPSRGPAHNKMDSLATDHMRAHAGLSYQQAYAQVYTHPDNRALRARVVAEHAAIVRAHAS